MSEAIKSLRGMLENGYIDRIEGRLPSGLGFEISSVYSSESRIIMENGEPKKIDMGELLGYHVTYWNEKLPKRILKPLVEDTVERHPDVKRLLKYAVLPTTRDIKSFNQQGKKTVGISREFYSANLSMRPEFFFDERYAQFLQDMEVTLGNAIPHE